MLFVRAHKLEVSAISDLIALYLTPLLVVRLAKPVCAVDAVASARVRATLRRAVVSAVRAAAKAQAANPAAAHPPATRLVVRRLLCHLGYFWRRSSFCVVHHHAEFRRGATKSAWS